MSRRDPLERTTTRRRVQGGCDGRQYSSCCLRSPGRLFIVRGWAWLVELEVDILWGRGNPQLTVGGSYQHYRRSHLRLQGCLGIAYPRKSNGGKRNNKQRNKGTEEELDPSSWDRILFCMAGHLLACFNEFMPPVAALELQQFIMQ